jgi:hypothetical protein
MVDLYERGTATLATAWHDCLGVELQAWLAREGLMFRVMRGGTVIGNGLKIKGDVSAEGLVEVNG